MGLILGLTDDGRLYVRRSDLEKAARKMGIGVEELAARLGARPEQAGRGARYVIDNAVGLILAKLLELEAKVEQLEARLGSRGDASSASFGEALAWAYSQARGPTGYAPLKAVKEMVASRLGISDAEFVKALADYVEANKGKVLLLQGGDEKIYVGGRAYGYIKLL
ncbi:MAG: hypothetical protein JZD41_00025 [Thermoproteus sp.]|nr:hypothetical protein [Thermoproteus sp.]